MLEEIIRMICFPWLVICRIFNLGKFEHFINDYDEPQYNEFNSMPIGNHAHCECKYCPFECTFTNF